MKLFDVLPNHTGDEYYRADEYFVEHDNVDWDYEHDEPEYHIYQFNYYGSPNSKFQVIEHNVEMHRMIRQEITHNRGKSPVDYKSKWFEMVSEITGEKYKIRVLCAKY